MSAINYTLFMRCRTTLMAAFGQKCFKNRWGIVSAVASVDVLSNDAETVGLYRDSITPSIRSRRSLWLWLSSATAIPLILYYSGTSPLLCSASYFRWSAGGHYGNGIGILMCLAAVMLIDGYVCLCWTAIVNRSQPISCSVTLAPSVPQ